MFTHELLTADFKTEPWHHQWVEFERSAGAPARALLWQMRTGKTKIVIDTACSLSVADLIDTVIIFAPNGVHQNWILRELPVHMWPSVPYHAIGWSTRVAGLKLRGRLTKADIAAWDDERAEWWQSYNRVVAGRELTFISFNSESMIRPDVRKAVAKLIRYRRCMVVWDESTDFRSPSSKRSFMSRAIALKVPYKRILDGTALTNSPLHAFSQYELLDRGALGFETYGDFQAFFAEYELTQRRGGGGRQYPVLKGYRNLDILQARMAPYSSVVLRADCEDLPPLVPRVRHVEMSPEQKRVYRETHKQLEVDVGNGDLVGINAQAVRIGKLQQVSSGFLIGEDKRVHRIPGPNPRLEALSEEVYLAPGKVIIWCMFQAEIDEVAARLRSDGWGIDEYHGRVSDEEKLRVRREFNTDDKKGIVGQPQAGGRGVEFSGADMVIWYGHILNAITRQQANERATKMGGGNVAVLDLVASPTDSYILASTAESVDVADKVAGRGMQDFLRSTKL